MSVTGAWGRTMTGDAGVGGPGAGWAAGAPRGLGWGAGLGWDSAVAGVEGRAAEEDRTGEHRRGSGRGGAGLGLPEEEGVC